MPSPSQRPIPIPLAERWRAFRMRVIPVVVFIIAASAAGLIWRQHIAAPMMVGKVESVRATVASPANGSLGTLRVGAFDEVTAGQTVAQVVRTDPQEVEHALAVIQAEINLIRAGMEPILSHERNILDLEQVRLDGMTKRVELASKRVRLQHAESEYQRVSQLHAEGLVSTDEYEAATAERDTLRTEVEELAKVVEDIEQTIGRRLGVDEEGRIEDLTAHEERLRAAIAVQEEELRLTEAQLRPVELEAPMDGRVARMHKRGGEYVTEGEPILDISGSESERVVAFLRQPIQFEPEPGMPVQVRRRGGDRQGAETEVLVVGSHLEPIAEVLRQPLNPQGGRELGLPLVINLPPELPVRPGELVDVDFVQPGFEWSQLF
ncbi:MAG: HlyD family secretion protein [Candidatus Hydrogenedentota bacterium]